MTAKATTILGTACGKNETTSRVLVNHDGLRTANHATEREITIVTVAVSKARKNVFTTAFSTPVMRKRLAYGSKVIEAIEAQEGGR